MKKLSQKIQYEFKDPTFLKRALTHRSAAADNNERLEFLGDSVVNFVVAEALFLQFPLSHEGELSRWRATLINRDTLADLAREFELGDYLKLGPGELKTEGAKRSSILSCGMEAVIGAIYLDGGFLAVQEVILKWYAPLLENLTSAASHKDPKTVLQEYMQRKKRALPTYQINTIEGEAHKQIFIVSCYVAFRNLTTTGQGTTRRKAEQDAAEAMLKVIKK